MPTMRVIPKSQIIEDAHRILRKGGLYGLHELRLTPNNLRDEQKAGIQRELAMEIKVNARPLTVDEWTILLEKQGFKILKVETNEMLLMEKKRVQADEGFFRTSKIAFNVVTHPHERTRLLNMRKTFRKNRKNLNAVAIVAMQV